MNSSWKSIAGSFLLGMVIAFAYGGYCYYKASQDSALAQNESTTIAHVSRMSRVSSNNSNWSGKCIFSFVVNGTSYAGHEICPDRKTDASSQETLMDIAGNGQDFTATVYYDPADPSTNSLLEFGARSESDSIRARLSIGVGVIFIILLVLGAAVVSNLSKGDGGIVVDAEGTVIYPDKTDSDQQK
jgi:hypothetical protein